MGHSNDCECGRGQAALHIVNKGMVVPAKPTLRHSYFLSSLDILWTGIHYNQRLIFYEAPLSDSGYGEAGGAATQVELLKSSLALCLVHYYPWCGRLAAGDRLSIDCNDAGVEFVEASVDLPISRLSSQGFQTKTFFEQLCQKIDPSGGGLYSSPLLSVQVTFFSDGGLSLGISQSHIVADGQAFWDFMVSWGECARGLPLSRHPVMDRQILALPNRQLAEEPTWDLVVPSTGEEEDELRAALDSLSLRKQPSPEEKASEATQVSSPNLDANGRSMGADPPSDDHKEKGEAEACASTETRPQCTPCVFILPWSAVTQLKVEDEGIHTSFEVIYAHLWQRIALARQRPPHEPSKVFVLANYRGRLPNLPVPPSYFGNTIGTGIVATTTKRICSESLHATATRIHNLVVRVVEESRVVGLMRFVEGYPDFVRRLFAMIPPGETVSVSSSTRFPAYEVDFGWGKPAAVRSPKVPGVGELVFFGGNPNLGRGDVEICTCLPTHVLRRLLKDPLFRGIPASDPFEDDD